MPFDFASISAPFRMQPGLRRLAAGASQLTPNHPGDVHLAEKLAILTEHVDQALLNAAGFDALPALHALATHASTAHPEAFAFDGAARFEAPHLAWSVEGDAVTGHGADAIGACLRALPAPQRPAALLSLAFAEDFAVIDGVSATIPWLAVCLPSHWAPEDKVGRHFAQVHAPVADNAVLVAASEHLARLVTGTERWERFVWTITRHPRLSQHPSRATTEPWPADADADVLAARAFFRTERQTFIPMPDRQQAIFTIHVERAPLAQAITQPEHARQLHAALGTMSPAVLAYRGLSEARDRLLDWLAVRGAA